MNCTSSLRSNAASCMFLFGGTGRVVVYQLGYGLDGPWFEFH